MMEQGYGPAMDPSAEVDYDTVELSREAKLDAAYELEISAGYRKDAPPGWSVSATHNHAGGAPINGWSAARAGAAPLCAPGAPY